MYNNITICPFCLNMPDMCSCHGHRGHAGPNCPHGHNYHSHGMNASEPLITALLTAALISSAPRGSCSHTRGNHINRSRR